MKVISIAAVAWNGVIGLKQGLPWNISEDLKFFRDATRGQMVLMGRNTFEALGKPLPHRVNAVLTRDQELSFPAGVRRFSDLAAALHYFKTTSEDAEIQNAREAGKNLFVIGGAQIYQQAMPWVDEVWLTEIEQVVEGDTTFPYYRDGKFLCAIENGAEQPFRFDRREVRAQVDLSSPFRYQFSFYRRVT